MGLSVGLQGIDAGVVLLWIMKASQCLQFLQPMLVIGEALRSETHALVNASCIADQVGIGRLFFATHCQILQRAIVSDS
jgi:hypothetical protein